MKKNNKAIVIAGPTGTGKTTLALSLARKFKTSIISADSRQVYIGADIGTNKIPQGSHTVEKAQGLWKIDDTAVHLYDVVTPDEDYSVSRFVKESMTLCERFWEEGTIPIIVGGTGFYIDALVGHRSFSSVPQDKQKRSERTALNAGQVFELLMRIDGEFASRLPVQVKRNTQRLLRYLELAEAAGGVAAATEWSPLKDTIDVEYIGLCADTPLLQSKADAWVEYILSHGLEEEVRNLLQKGYEDTALMKGLIYRPMVEYTQGIYDLPMTQEKIKRQLRAYIKRQLTWFNVREEIRWFDIQKASYSQEIIELVELFVTA